MILQQQIIEELQYIPENKLAEIYDLIHYFRLGLDKEKSKEHKATLLKGQRGDAFFEPLLEKERSLNFESSCEGTKILQIMEQHNLLGCMDSDSDLSVNYKKHLWEGADLLRCNFITY